MIPRRAVKIKFFLSVVIPVVKATFVPFSATGGKPAIARAARPSGLLSKPLMDRVYALPKQARYQLRYTRLFRYFIRLGVFSQIKRATNCAIPGYLILNHYSTKFVRLKDFSVCGHLCGQDHFCAVFGNRWKSRKCRCHKALRHFALPCPGYRHGTPKAGAIPSSLYPVVRFRRDIIPNTTVPCKVFRIDVFSSL